MNRASIPTDPVGRAGFFVFLALAFSVLAVLGAGLFGGDEAAENATLFTVSGSLPASGEPTPAATTAPAAATATPTAAATALPQATAIATAVPTATVEADPTPVPTVEDTEEPTPEPTATDSDADGGENSDGDDADEPTPEPTEEPPPPAVAVSSSFARTLRATGDVGVAAIYDAPDGNLKEITYTYLDGTVVQNDITNPTYFGNPLVFRVLEGGPDDTWAKVMVPTRPNGQVGWIQTDLYEWGSSNYLIQIDVTTNRVAVFNGEELVLETDAVTGKDASPTPILTAFVDEKIFGRGGPYGPALLSLGVYSNALNTFGANGEVPKIALHGTDSPWLMGEYDSNGCIRVENDVITQIADLVPVGTKVEIIRS